MNTFRKLIWTSSYTEYHVLTSSGKCLERYEKYKKMSEMKVIAHWGEQILLVALKNLSTTNFGFLN